MKKPFLLLLTIIFVLGKADKALAEETKEVLFAKTYGYIRYFTPNQLSSDDWNHFSVYAFKRINTLKQAEFIQEFPVWMQKLGIEASIDTYPKQETLHVSNKMYVKAVTGGEGKYTYVWAERFGLSPYRSKLEKLNKEKIIEYQLHHWQNIRLDDTHYLNYKGIAQHKIKPQKSFLETIRKQKNSADSIQSPAFRLASSTILFNSLKFFKPEIQLEEWNQFLPELLTQSIQHQSNEEYLTLTQEVLHKIKDAHSAIIPKFKVKRPKYFAPFLLRFQGEKIVVDKSFTAQNKNSEGQEIISVNNQRIAQIYKEKQAITSSANPLFSKNRIAPWLLNSSDSSILIQFKNESKIVSGVNASTYNKQYLQSYLTRKKEFETSVLDSNCYFDFSFKKHQYRQVKRKIKKCSSTHVVFDYRQRPMTSYRQEKLLRHFSKSTLYNLTWRRFKYYSHQPELKEIKDTQYKYKPKKNLGKKLIVLASESTFSYSETLVALVKNNQLGTVVGRITAGSNGDPIAVNTPLFKFMFSPMFGVDKNGKYYIKEGLQPDINVPYNSLEETKRDVILDRALEMMD